VSERLRTLSNDAEKALATLDRSKDPKHYWRDNGLYRKGISFIPSGSSENLKDEIRSHFTSLTKLRLYADSLGLATRGWHPKLDDTLIRWIAEEWEFRREVGLGALNLSTEDELRVAYLAECPPDTSYPQKLLGHPDEVDPSHFARYQRLYEGPKKYFITAMVMVRLYRLDPSEMTTVELIQWLQYFYYAGVDHVYFYDSFSELCESQILALQPFVELGMLTYVDWHDYNPFFLEDTKIVGFQHNIDHYGREYEWQLQFDIDEYPFHPRDTEPGFLHRLLFNTPHSYSQVLFNNYIFHGWRDWDKEFLVEQLDLRISSIAKKNLVKPAFRVDQVKRAGIHQNVMKGNGNQRQKEARMNHYWGPRVLDHKPEIPDTLRRTLVEDRDIFPIADRLRPFVRYPPFGLYERHTDALREKNMEEWKEWKEWRDTLVGSKRWTGDADKNLMAGVKVHFRAPSRLDKWARGYKKMMPPSMAMSQRRRAEVDEQKLSFQNDKTVRRFLGRGRRSRKY